MIYFITEKYLKDFTPIGNNVDMSKIDYLINDSYNLVASRLLGSYFAKWLLDKHQTVVSGSGTYTAPEDELVDKLQSVMAWHVVMSGIEGLSDNLTNKGAQKSYGDYSNSSSDTQVRFLSQKYSNKFEEYKDVLINFMCENKTEFPEFTSELNKSSLILKSCKCGGNDLRDLGLMIG